MRLHKYVVPHQISLNNFGIHLCDFFSESQNVYKIRCIFRNESIEIIELFNIEIYERNRWVENRFSTTEVRIGKNIQNQARRDNKMENTKEEKTDIKDKIRRSKQQLSKYIREIYKRIYKEKKIIFKVIMILEFYKASKR